MIPENLPTPATVPHTPGKIKFRANGDANSYALLDDTGNWWLSLLMNGEQMTARQEANLKRIEACWNAFEGVPTERIKPFMATLQGIGRDLPGEEELISQGRDFAESERTTNEVLAAIEARIQAARS